MDRQNAQQTTGRTPTTVSGRSLTKSVRAEDFRGLRHLANRLGDRFRAGIVLYAGEQPLSFGDRLAALPMARFVDARGAAQIPRPS
jgi:hypothetical protein